jgi:AbiV family abortive infection protein
MKNQGELIKLAGKHEPIVATAIRLLDDAKLLRKSKRYPTATAMAVLSMEEVGKLVLYHDAFKLQRKMQMSQNSTRNHAKKQSMVAGLLIGNLLIDEVDELIKVADSTKASDFASGKLTRQDLVRLIGSIDRELYVQDNPGKLKNYRHHGFLIDLAAGYFDCLKQHSFYADVDHRGTWSDSSDKIDRQMADKSLQLAQVAINTAHRAMKCYEWQLAHWRF